MPHYSPEPINDTDAAARRAFRRICNEAPGIDFIGEQLGVSTRTLERIRDGQRYLPPGLARDMAALVDDLEQGLHFPEHLTLKPSAAALRAWADQCDREQEARNHG